MITFASCPNFPVVNCCHFPTVRTFLTFQFNRFHIISHIFAIFHIISQHFTTFHNYRNMFLSSFSVPNCIPGPKRATPHWLEPPRRDPSAATSWAPARGVLHGSKKKAKKKWWDVLCLSAEVVSCGKEEQIVENSRSDWPPQPRSAPGHSAGGNDEKNQEKIALGWEPPGWEILCINM